MADQVEDAPLIRPPLLVPISRYRATAWTKKSDAALNAAAAGDSTAPFLGDIVTERLVQTTSGMCPSRRAANRARMPTTPS